MNEQDIPRTTFRHRQSKEMDAIRQISTDMSAKSQLEEAWRSSRSAEDPMNPSVESLIFDKLSSLRNLKQVIPVRRLGERASIRTEGISSVDYFLNHAVSRLTLSEVLEHPTELARENPVGMYGFMLLSTLPFRTTTHQSQSSIDFLPVTAFTPNEINDLIKNAAFPVHINSLLRTLSSAYQESLRRVRGDFYNPKSPTFPAIEQLVQDIDAKGTSFHRDLFNEQILYMGGHEQGRCAYARFQELLKEENAPELYRNCLIAIEDSFDGLIGEEYELFGIEQHLGATIDNEAYTRIEGKIQVILKLLKESAGTIPLPDGRYGEMSLAGVDAHHRKSGKNTYFGFTAHAKTVDEDYIPIWFQSYGHDRYAWSFLRSSDEVPELGNMVLQATEDIVDQASSLIARPQTASNPISSPVKPTRYERDEIYELRKEERRRDKQWDNGPKSQISRTVRNIDEPPAHILEVEIPPHIANSLDADTLAKTEKAIEKYNSGLRNSKLILSLSENGDKTFRLREGAIRVLFKQRGDKLIVINAGKRKTIYK